MIAATPWMRRRVPGWRKKYELDVIAVAIHPIQSYIPHSRREKKGHPIDSGV
jgi:hypothetical protein